MKSRGTLIVWFLIISFSLLHATSAPGGVGDFFKGIKKAVGLGGELSESKIVDGLKEALKIGANNAVKMVSQVDGYNNNPKIKIPLPSAVRKVEKLLRVAGYGQHLDAFKLSMNRAAEQAAPKAGALFGDAIKEMTIADARQILNGRDNEATLYFKDKTQDRLDQIFKPIVHAAMSKVGVTRRYQELDTKVRSLPFAESLSFDLDQYVTGLALNGLFLTLAEEERKIRHDPAARTTDLLKKVFGSKH